MAIANLHETILSLTLRKSQLQNEISDYQATKNLALFQTTDLNSALARSKQDVRDYFKNLFESDPDLQELYKDYTEIPDFEEEIDKLTASVEEQLEEISAWETSLDNQITTDSAEMTEIDAYLQSYKTMLSSNIQEDFNYGLNG